MKLKFATWISKSKSGLLLRMSCLIDYINLFKYAEHRHEATVMFMLATSNERLNLLM